MVIFLAFYYRISDNLIRDPAISVLAMKHRPRIEEQDDLLRPRFVDLIDPRHALVKLAGMIDWAVFERE